MGTEPMPVVSIRTKGSPCSMLDTVHPHDRQDVGESTTAETPMRRGRRSVVGVLLALFAGAMAFTPAITPGARR